MRNRLVLAAVCRRSRGTVSAPLCRTVPFGRINQAKKRVRLIGIKLLFGKLSVVAARRRTSLKPLISQVAFRAQHAAF